MKAVIKDGGAAFPATDYYDEKAIGQHYGMTLRDYFAAQVLPAVYAASIARGSDLQDVIADEAYELADQMLIARENQS